MEDLYFIEIMDNKEIWEFVKDQKWQTEENISDLVGLAKKISDVNGLIVDIGIGGATSACALALASGCPVYSIGEQVAPIAVDTVIRLGLEGRVFFCAGESDNVWKNWDRLVNMVFIDGMHTYDAVTSDAEKWGDWIKYGGILAFHDYDLYRNTIGKAIDDFYEKHKEDYKPLETGFNIKAFQKI